MGSNLTHTVSGNVASFRSADKTNIESLKVHFLPVQEGSGNPSTENVRNISGWNQVEVNKQRKNIGHIIGYSASTVNSITGNRILDGRYGTTISTINYTLPDTSLTVTQSQWPNTSSIYSYQNGYFCVAFDNLIFGQSYDFSFKITNITNNPLNAQLSQIRINGPGSGVKNATEIQDNVLIFRNVSWVRHSVSQNRCTLDIYNCGMSFTISEFMVTPVYMNDGVFESYCGSIIPIIFPNNNIIPGGYIDLISGKLTQTHYKLVFDGTETTYNILGNGQDCIRVMYSATNNAKILPAKPRAEQSINDGKYSHGSYTVNNDMTVNQGIGTSNVNKTDTYAIIWLPYNIYTSDLENDVKSYIKGQYDNNTPIELCYPLETPIIYQLSPQQLKTFLNYNNIWSNTNDITEVTYEVIDHLTQKRASIPKQKRRVLWNQISGAIDENNWKVYSTSRGQVTYNNGVAELEILVDGIGSYSVSLRSNPYPTVTAGHTYYASYMVNPDHDNYCGLEFGNNKQFSSKYFTPANTWTRCQFIVQTTTTGVGAMYIPFPYANATHTGYKFLLKSPIYVDLTRMFGHGNEPTIESFERMCKLNNIDLTQFHSQDLQGTEQIWYIDNFDKNHYTTLEWNQLLWALGTTYWEPYNTSYASATYEDGVLTRTVLQDTSSSWTASIRSKSVLTTDTTHKYYIKQELYSSVAKIYVLTLGGSWCKQVTVPANTWTVCETIGVPQQSEKMYVIYDGNGDNLSKTGDICKLRNPLVIDLTQMFGAGNEPTLQEFRALCTANGVNLDSALPRDTGTKQLWIT